MVGKQTEQGNNALPLANGLRRKENLYIAAGSGRPSRRLASGERSQSSQRRDGAGGGKRPAGMLGTAAQSERAARPPHRSAEKKKSVVYKAPCWGLLRERAARGVNFGPGEKPGWCTGAQSPSRLVHGFGIFLGERPRPILGKEKRR